MTFQTEVSNIVFKGLDPSDIFVKFFIVMKRKSNVGIKVP